MSNWFSQGKRFLQLSTNLGRDALILTKFTGAEKLSNPFHFSLEMFSENTLIDAKTLIGTPVGITLNSGSTPRYFHGIIRSFEAGMIEHGIQPYYAEVVPWFGLLGFTSDCRIFQNKTVIEIAKTIFDENRFRDYDT